MVFLSLYYTVPSPCALRAFKQRTSFARKAARNHEVKSVRLNTKSCPVKMKSCSMLKLERRCADGKPHVAINSRTQSFEIGLGLSPGNSRDADLASDDPVLLSGEYRLSPVCIKSMITRRAFLLASLRLLQSKDNLCTTAIFEGSSMRYILVQIAFLSWRQEMHIGHQTKSCLLPKAGGTFKFCSSDRVVDSL